MPTNTDLVKDLPADFEIFGQAVDTQMKTNADAAIAKTIVDAKGDIIAATAADTVSRLAVGSNDQVLTADSSTATGLKWATVSGGANYQLLNSGGTSLTGSTVTISGISGKSSICVYVLGASCTAGAEFRLRLNGDSNSNYKFFGISVPNSNESQRISATAENNFTFGSLGNAGGVTNSFIQIDGTNADGIKSINCGTYGDDTNGQARVLSGMYIGTSAITSVSITTNGTFDAGTVYVYGG
jgi:hypothetical protein